MHRLRQQSGFTLVEVMVAALVLAIGVSGAFALLDRANASISQNNARVAATNLARELVEYARGTDYDALQPGQVEPALRSRQRIAGAPGTWRIERRGVTYTIGVTTCVFDDPKDGLAATAPPNACTPAAQPLTGAPTEVNPDDFRRVSFTLRWTDKAGPHTLSQTTLVVNPSGGLGPRIRDLPEPASQLGPGTLSWTFTPVTSDPAQTLRWTVDDGVSQGELPGTGATTSWAFTWNLGTWGLAPFVQDGTYSVTAQAFDGRGVPGEARTVTVHVNRRHPVAPGGVEGGRNEQHGGVVDIRWQRNAERDVIGYRVNRLDGLSTTRICPAAGQQVTESLHCTDTNPPILPLVSYEVVAVDREDLKNVNSQPRDGDVASHIVGPAGAKPDPPQNPIVEGYENGAPRLRWDPPASGDVLFYRIYRDDAPTLDRRYDVTVTNDSWYTDVKPGGVAHRYWITAVGPSFNESDPSPYVDSNAPVAAL